MNSKEILTTKLTEIYEQIPFQISNLNVEREGTEYDACQFSLDGMQIICRSSKITAKKLGQFVTFWKRNKKGITAPFYETDQLDFYVINVKTETQFGQFVFPKKELIAKGIISTSAKDGKRGFRVYPVWDNPVSKQALKTQEWQLKYFFEINEHTHWNFVSKLYEK